MIRRLSLKNWRNYEDIDLKFEPGTTFIVAPNGIGKTSLMEAAAWAIFGESGQRPSSAVRIGAPSATATAEVELPDQRILTITRTLPKKSAAALSPPAAHIDGKKIEAALAADEIRRSYAADPAFLVRLTMSRQHIDATDPAEFGLHEHLCRFFGVEALLRAGESLDQRIKSQEKKIRAARQGSPADASKLSALRDRVSAHEEAARDAAVAHERASEILNMAREKERYLTHLREWQEKATSYSQALAELASAAAPDVALDPQHPETSETALSTAANSIQLDLEALRVRQAHLAGRSSAIAQHSSELQEAHGDCPVCRRPLDAETVRLARSAHEDELTRVRAEMERLHRHEAELVVRQLRVRGLIQTFRELPHPGPKPTDASTTDASTTNTVTQPSLDELDAELRMALEQVVSCRAAVATSENELNAALAEDRAHAQLQRLYAQEAVLRASRDAISAATSQLLNDTIQPLAREVDARWGQVFPQRGRLRTVSTGAVSREIAGEQLPDSAFSTGERTGLVILLRLLVLESATNANFCWFDEPLEHLDPDARRQVAGILARSSSAGHLRQIVVTTYEEPLARRLQERDPRNVRLVYVRPSPG